MRSTGHQANLIIIPQSLHINALATTALFIKLLVLLASLDNVQSKKK